MRSKETVGKPKGSVPVVHVNHGLFDSSDNLIMTEDINNAVPYVLAKEGYDVWLGNNRGCIFSRKNTHLNPDIDYVKFFDYSFYELGKYDAPT